MLMLMNQNLVTLLTQGITSRPFFCFPTLLHFLCSQSKIISQKIACKSLIMVFNQKSWNKSFCQLVFFQLAHVSYFFLEHY